jgi:hypothetical protein
MTRPLTRDVRKAIPLSVKVEVLLRMLGLKGVPINWDHDPALALREWDADSGDFIPPQLDPDYIFAKPQLEHRTKTTGRKGEKRSTSYGSDAHAIAKLDRLTPAAEDFRRRMLAKAPGEPAPERERPKHRIPSRPFPKGGRKLQSRGFR